MILLIGYAYLSILFWFLAIGDIDPIWLMKAVTTEVLIVDVPVFTWVCIKFATIEKVRRIRVDYPVQADNDSIGGINDKS